MGSLDEVTQYYEALEMAIPDEVTRIIGAKAEGVMEGKLDDARKMLSSVYRAHPSFSTIPCYNYLLSFLAYGLG